MASPRKIHLTKRKKKVKKMGSSRKKEIRKTIRKQAEAKQDIL